MGDILNELAAAEKQLQQLNGHRLTFELCENVHFHWRNCRIETSFTNAISFFHAAVVAADQLMSSVRGKIVRLPLSSICPFNYTHRRASTGRGWVCGIHDDLATAEHERGVDFWKTSLLAGKEPWPIAVRPWYLGGFERAQDAKKGNIFQRLDGFKRFMAHAELGREAIVAFIVDTDARGCQEHMPQLFRHEFDALEEAFGPNNFECLSLTELTDLEAIASNRVELLRDGTFHIHVGDVRLEFTDTEFRNFANLINTALRNEGD